MTNSFHSLKSALLSAIASVVVAGMFIAAAAGPALTSTVA